MVVQTAVKAEEQAGLSAGVGPHTQDASCFHLFSVVWCLML